MQRFLIAIMFLTNTHLLADNLDKAIDAFNRAKVVDVDAFAIDADVAQAVNFRCTLGKTVKDYTGTIEKKQKDPVLGGELKVVFDGEGPWSHMGDRYLSSARFRDVGERYPKIVSVALQFAKNVGLVHKEHSNLPGITFTVYARKTTTKESDKGNLIFGLEKGLDLDVLETEWHSFCWTVESF